jgi:hypothetical protein
MIRAESKPLPSNFSSVVTFVWLFELTRNASNVISEVAIAGSHDSKRLAITVSLPPITCLKCSWRTFKTNLEVVGDQRYSAGQERLQVRLLSVAGTGDGWAYDVAAFEDFRVLRFLGAHNRQVYAVLIGGELGWAR